MKKLLIDIKNGILGSFSNDAKGFSGKKMVIFVICICVVLAHVKWLALKDFTQLTTVLTIDYTFICTLFGINVVDKVKNPTKENSNPE